ncbi:MAG: radical SAM family heme chaperone HemW [Lachnospiraceae bacterium]|nr:radical SAM family heme chaperone HemW [Lachnospiraceae bacterium]
MIYVHVPFCPRKCAYCDFYSAPAGEETVRTYFEDLREEIRENPFACPGVFRGGREKVRVSSVFFGGGTPSYVPEEEIVSVMALLRERFHVLPDAEISLEANPGSLTEGKCRAYRKAGVNRLSLGLQSADDRLLRKIGRIHDYEGFLESFRTARAAGFDNINVDLISGLPLDTPENYEKGLVKVLSLQPEHLSVYSLIIAENTPFYALYGPGGSLVRELPDEDAERTMYSRTGEILKDAGYHRYEISNYALSGRECRHNTGYWSHVPYLGFGAAAASFVPLWGEDVMLRYRNVSSHDYLGKPYEEQETLTEEELRREYMMLRLRMTEGVSDADFRARFGISLFDAFPDEIRKTVREGLLAYRADPAETEKAEAAGVFLTPKGLDLANLVFEEFL